MGGVKGSVRIFTAGAGNVPAVRGARRNDVGEFTVASTCPDCAREVFAFMSPTATTAYFGCSACGTTMLVGLKP